MKDFSYNDIIDYKYPSPEIEADFPDKVLRSAQFAPFSALVGYDEAVEEVARLTDSEIELTDEEKLKINEELRTLILNENKNVKITYFEPDEKKLGGAYLEKSGIVKKVREFEHDIIFSDGEKIKIERIVKIEKGVI